MNRFASAPHVGLLLLLATAAWSLAGCGDEGAVAVTPVNTVRVTVSHVDRGWWNDSGDHTATNQNTLTGRASLGDVNRSYFTFDLAGVSGIVVDAVLRLEVESYNGTQTTESLGVWDVTTDPAVLDADATGNTAVFDDLGTGETYAGFSVSAGDVGTVLDIALSDGAVIDIDAALGAPFSVGVRLDTLDASGTDWVRFSSSTEARIHELVLDVLP